MSVFLLTFVLFSIAVLVMTGGVLISGRSLKGSCGGPSCSCAREGKEIGSCDVDDSTLPVYPVSNQ
jgi:hypothetical protein